MLMSCINLVSEIKKRCQCDDITIFYTGEARLVIRVNYEKQKFSYQRTVNMADWLTYEDELNDLFSLVEETLAALKAFGRKADAKLDTRPVNTQADTQA